MSIYIVHCCKNLWCAEHTNIEWKAVFSVTAEKCSQSHLWACLEANSRGLVQRQRMPDGQMLFVDSTVHSASNGVLSAVADDQRYPRQRHRSLSGTSALCCADTDGLWWRACTRLDLPHRVSASRHIAAATVHGHTSAFCWRDMQRRSVWVSWWRARWDASDGGGWWNLYYMWSLATLLPDRSKPYLAICTVRDLHIQPSVNADNSRPQTT